MKIRLLKKHRHHEVGSVHDVIATIPHGDSEKHYVIDGDIYVPSDDAFVLIEWDMKERLAKMDLEEALPHKGECTYTSPCIVGSALNEEEQRAMQKAANESDDLMGWDKVPIGRFTELYPNSAVFNMTREEAGDLATLQNSFDVSTVERFMETYQNMREKYA